LTSSSSVAGNQRVYRFAAKEIPALSPEPAMPPWPEVLGSVHVSTYKNWDDLGRWYWGLVKDQFDLDEETRKLAKKITEGKTSELDKVKAIYKWVTENTRYVADGDVASSAGVSAALPISLALVETIAGPQAARGTADRLGVESWSAAHDSDVFKVRLTDLAVHSANMRLKHADVVTLKVRDGDDEVALSLQAEAWSRTMRDKVHIVSDTASPVRMRGGLRVLHRPHGRPRAHLALANRAHDVVAGPRRKRVARLHVEPRPTRLDALVAIGVPDQLDGATLTVTFPDCEHGHAERVAE